MLISGGAAVLLACPRSVPLGLLPLALARCALGSTYAPATYTSVALYAPVTYAPAAVRGASTDPALGLRALRHAYELTGGLAWRVLSKVPTSAMRGPVSSGLYLRRGSNGRASDLPEGALLPRGHICSANLWKRHVQQRFRAAQCGRVYDNIEWLLRSGGQHSTDAVRRRHGAAKRWHGLVRQVLERHLSG